MKFRLDTSGHFYDNPDKRRKLEGLGFSFEKNINEPADSPYSWTKMDDEIAIDIASLQDLIAFMANYGTIVMSRGIFGDDETPTIEIYDDYRE